jgi:hypothetical protein
MFAGAVIVGNAAGVTVIVLDTDASGLPQGSVAVQVSVTVPPQAGGVVVKVDEFEFPLIRHPPPWLLLKVMVLAAGIAPQATVILAGAVIVGRTAGDTVISLDTDAKGLPQGSVAVQVSVTVPPHAGGVVVIVEEFEFPLIRQPPLSPLVKVNLLAAGIAPQATVMLAGAVIAGKAAGLNVTALYWVAVLPQRSVAVKVAVTDPPQLPAVPDNAAVTVTLPPQLSAALTPVAAQAVNPPVFPQSNAGIVPIVKRGGVVSLTVMIWVQVATLPQASVAL